MVDHLAIAADLLNGEKWREADGTLEHAPGVEMWLAYSSIAHSLIALTEEIRGLKQQLDNMTGHVSINMGS